MNIIKNVFYCCGKYNNNKLLDIDITNNQKDKTNNIILNLLDKTAKIKTNQSNNTDNNSNDLLSKDNYIPDNNPINDILYSNDKLISSKEQLSPSGNLSFTNMKLESGNKKECYAKLLLSGELFFDKELIITNEGMIEGKRLKKDGRAVFGLQKTKDLSGNPNNDFIINYPIIKDDDINYQSETQNVFQIEFDKIDKEYYLYFLHQTLFLYYKITSYVYFSPKKKYILFVGYIFISIDIKYHNDEQYIYIDIDNENQLNKNEIGVNYKFSQKKSIIRIGRNNCDININEKCISKIHGIIQFSEANNQFFYRDLNSTNGTTLLVKRNDSLRINGEMNFKLEDIPFKIQEVP